MRLTLSVLPAALVTLLALTPGASAQSASICALTPAETEGPYYSQGAPAKSNLAADTRTGTRLTVTGRVLDAKCQPVRGAVIDLWQADAQGQYDNRGFALRGKVTTDAQGRYTFTTVVPGRYPGRTEHIHVKVTPPGGRTLTTQLYLPNNANNARDRIYERQMELQNYRLSGTQATANFTFVVAR